MAITALNTAVTFNGGTIDKVNSISGARSRNIIPVLTTDAADDAVAKIAGALDEGEITVNLDYDGAAAGVYNDLNTAFQAATSGTLLITLSDTSSFSCTAIISAMDIPQFGAADGKVECSITFAITGKATYTDVAA
jgi:hypothetical protein